MRIRMTIVVISFLAVPRLAMADASGFKMTDVQCQLLAATPKPRILPLRKGSMQTSFCKATEDSRITCVAAAGSTKYRVFDEGRLVALLSENGNVRYLLDFANRSYSMGMVSEIPERNVVLTKMCIGKIIPLK